MISTDENIPDKYYVIEKITLTDLIKLVVIVYGYGIAISNGGKMFEYGYDGANASFERHLDTESSNKVLGNSCKVSRLLVEYLNEMINYS